MGQANMRTHWQIKIWKHENVEMQKYEMCGTIPYRGWKVKMSGEHKRGEIEGRLSNNGGQNIHSGFVCVVRKKLFCKQIKGKFGNKLYTRMTDLYEYGTHIVAMFWHIWKFLLHMYWNHSSIHIFLNHIGAHTQINHSLSWNFSCIVCFLVSLYWVMILQDGIYLAKKSTHTAAEEFCRNIRPMYIVKLLLRNIFDTEPLKFAYGSIFCKIYTFTCVMYSLQCILRLNQ